MTKSIKITLAFLLFLCVLNMPYVYYQFVRIACVLGFSLLAYDSYKNDNDFTNVITYVFLVLVFQPFNTVGLNKITWNIIDIIVGIGLLISLKKENIN
jgi:hypothetical protein